MTWTDFYSGEHDGHRYGDSGHSGWDVKRHPVGTAVPIPCDGQVVRSRFNFFYGWYVTVRCTHGLLCSRAHLQKRGAKKGTVLKAGDVVGSLGSTGFWSTGPHVHCGQSTSKSPALGNRIDPRPHILEQSKAIVAASQAQRAAAHAQALTRKKKKIWLG